jgi:D-inositol-3-phosphate glycosyltransferase
VPDRQPSEFARHIRDIIDNPVLANQMSYEAATRARRYTWSFAGARLRRVYADLVARDRVECR